MLRHPPQRLVEAPQVRAEDDGWALAEVALGLQRRRVEVDRIAGGEGQLRPDRDRLAGGRRRRAGGAVGGADEPGVPGEQGERDAPRLEVPDGLPRVGVGGDADPTGMTMRTSESAVPGACAESSWPRSPAGAVGVPS